MFKAATSRHPGIQTLWIALLVFSLNQAIELTHLRFYDKPYAALCDWDCGWYASIVEGGYDEQAHAHERGDAANWAFFPAFSLTARAVALLGDWPTGTTLIICSKLFFLLSIAAFIRFAQSWATTTSPWVAGAVAALHPYALYGNVGYTEPMYLLFSCLCLTAARQGRFLSAGLAGGVLSAVRPTGIFVILAVAAEALRRFPGANHTLRLKMVLGVLLVPMGLALFMAFLHHLMGDALAFSHVQIAWSRIPDNPFVHLYQGLIATDPLRQLWAFMALCALLMSAWLGWRGEYGLAAFAVCATLVPLSTGLAALPRYLWWQAPLLLVLAQMLSVGGRRMRFPGHGVYRQTLLRLVSLLPYVVLPLSLWGQSLMYRAWMLREGYVI